MIKKEILNIVEISTDGPPGEFITRVDVSRARGPGGLPQLSMEELLEVYKVA